MKKLRRATEPEIVAEFLKNEFYEPEFHRDRARFERLVLDADLANETENALRMALLFRRRAVLWRELPAAVQWWEIQLEPEDVPNVRVFPRAQWRRVANGSYRVADVVERLRRAQGSQHSGDFYSKIQSLSYRLRHEPDNSSVLLIGTKEESPLTLIEGNHRFTAAMLVSPTLVTQRFRFYCGLSPRMDECCWYKSNLPNLWRYAKNRARHFFYDPDDHLRRIQPHDEAVECPSQSYAEAVVSKVMSDHK